MFHGLDLGDFREVLWVNDDLVLIPSTEISVDVALVDLGFIDSAIFPEAVGKPLCGISVQCPRQSLHVLCIHGCDSTINGDHIIQVLKLLIVLLIHQQSGIGRLEQ